MKKHFKYLLLILFTILIMPKVINAESTLTLEKVEEKNNTAQYNIVLEVPEGEDAPSSLSLKLEKTNVVENLEYNIVESDNSAISGSCDKGSLTCNLVTTTLSGKTTIATVSITNSTVQEQVTKIKISGDLSTDEKTIILKAMQTTTTVPTTTITTTQKILSQDTSLSSIQVSAGVMDQTFSKDIFSYNVTEIKDTINKVTITPDCDNNCSWVITCPLGECSVSNSRIVTLQVGANKVSINVTSEDGQNSKAYILNVYRGEIETSSAYLTDIKIKDATLSPNFDTMTNDYTTTVGMDVEKLEIETVAEDPEAKIEIKGNENLIEGENTVTITVTSSDNENKQVYSIIVTKEEIEEEEPIIEEETEEPPITKVEKKKNNLWLIIVISLLALGAIITTAILIFRKKKSKKNNKNNKNNKGGGSKVEDNLPQKKDIEKENTDSLNILNETRRQMYEEPKQSVDEALDDLMQTKRLELGDLGL